MSNDKKTIRIACIDSEAPPLFNASPDGITRTGYEPSVAKLVFDELGYDITWVMIPWEDMIPAVLRGDADAVWCGQGMTPERSAQVDFSIPYAVFNESLVVRAGDPARSPEDLEGYTIGAIAESTNMKLAATFPGVKLVSFGSSDDVFRDMIEATRNGTIDGFVDDDVAMIPLADEPDFDMAFTIETRNRWGVGVKPGNDELREGINRVLDEAIKDGRLQQIWNEWMPTLPFPLKPSGE